MSGAVPHRSSKHCTNKTILAFTHITIPGIVKQSIVWLKSGNNPPIKKLFYHIDEMCFCFPDPKSLCYTSII